MTGQIISLLKAYQDRTENSITNTLSRFGENGKLREACEYALMNGGKRFRPALVFMVADALAQNRDVSFAALSIEYFHTASLIADDLPCMDDDDERRNKPSLHKVFGEATALLASYALIAAGNECIAQCARVMDKESEKKGYKEVNGCRLGILALENAARNTGSFGTTGGQFLDVYPPNLSVETLRSIIHMKTVSLFEVSFIFGWLFGGGDDTKLPIVKQAASHFGMAFQIADDFGDTEQDIINGRLINIPNILGVDKAKTMFHMEILGYRNSLKKLGLESDELLALASSLEGVVKS